MHDVAGKEKLVIDEELKSIEDGVLVMREFGNLLLEGIEGKVGKLYVEILLELDEAGTIATHLHCFPCYIYRGLGAVGEEKVHLVFAPHAVLSECIVEACQDDALLAKSSLNTLNQGVVGRGVQSTKGICLSVDLHVSLVMSVDSDIALNNSHITLLQDSNNIIVKGDDEKDTLCRRHLQW